MENWFGLSPHPTDKLIHWSERDPAALAAKLREAYDKIVAAGLLAEHELLQEAKEAKSGVIEQMKRRGKTYSCLNLGKELVMAKKKKEEITPRSIAVHLAYESSTCDLDGKLDDAIAFLEAKRQEIPEELRHTATIEVSSEDYYGNTGSYYTITYYRPETVEEIAEREAAIRAREREAVEAREKRELKEYKRLKAKFEKGKKNGKSTGGTRV